MASRRPPPPAEPPDDGLGDGEFDPTADDFDAAEAGARFADAGDDPAWLLTRVNGGNPVADPRVDPRQLRAKLEGAPLARCTVDAAERWSVEKVNPVDGSLVALGYAPLDVTTAGFMRRFMQSMPRDHEEPIEFYLTPLDKAGNALGQPGKPYSRIKIGPDHAELQALRAVSAGAGSDPNAGMLALLRAQLEEIRAQREEAQRRADLAALEAAKARDAAVAERLRHATTMHGELAETFTLANRAQQSAMTDLIKVQQEVTKGDAEARRAELVAERERLAREADARVAAIKAEADARAAAAKVEADAKLALAKLEMEAREKAAQREIDLRMKEMELKIEQAKAAAAAEQARLDRERDREDQRRKEEQARMDALRDAEEKRRADYALQMEKIRTDALAADQRRQDAETNRQADHMKTMLALIEARFSAQSGTSPNKFGVIGELLDTVGMTPADALAKAKELFAGGSAATVGTVIAEGIFELGKELVKRLPLPEDEEEEEEEEERLLTDGRERVEGLDSPAPAPAPAERARARESAAEVIADLPRAPDRATRTSRTRKRAASPLEATRAGRDAVAEAVEALEGVPPEDTGAVVQSLAHGADLVAYVRRVGLLTALADYPDLDVAAFRAAVAPLFDGPVPDDADGGTGGVKETA